MLSPEALSPPASLTAPNGNLTPDQIQKTQRLYYDIDNSIDFFDLQTGIFNDNLLTGDQLFGSSPSQSVLEDVLKRNRELKGRKDELSRKIQVGEDSAQVFDTDFKDALESGGAFSSPSTVLHVLDDYTLAVLIMSWVFLALSLVIYYSASSGYNLWSIITGVVYACGMTLILAILAGFFL
jgi:hypothetical protein